ncbi:hypothetical protein ILUMI_27120 [Ignelater luminosus]|uniref:Uncharacterized protein n=1 Tax=Ignelater luminosus TaxID=2038154 RepID=A0A8K0C5I8_IGNLU|nr:hypothetical protein ILUMI_27120 [Ignelater luminosus]
MNIPSRTRLILKSLNLNAESKDKSRSPSKTQRIPENDNILAEPPQFTEIHCTKDDTRPERPSTSYVDENIKRVRSLVPSDRRFTVRMVSDEPNLEKHDSNETFRG